MGNVLLGNLIESSSVGVIVESASNSIGGTASGSGNDISSNTAAGVLISGVSASSNVVIGNFIGTDIGDDNQGNGVGVIVDAPGNTIGGTAAGAGNLIGFNTSAGISITNASGAGDVVLGNSIGADGLTDVGNGVGVVVACSFNTIGGTAAGAGNVIGFNTSAGVSISGQGAFGNAVIGNFIGTDSDDDAVGNATGVVDQAGGNTIGGTAAGAGNVIGFNTSAGISISIVSISGQGGAGDVVLGNDIGTDADADNLANAVGVVIESANNTIGGSAAGAGNTIGFSTSAGVSISGSGATGNVLFDNDIGNDGVGDDLANAVGVILDAPANTIGGSGAGNLIEDNDQAGVSISGAAATSNVLLGNLILESGVGVIVESADNTIGGTAAGAGEYDLPEFYGRLHIGRGRDIECPAR